MKLYLVCSKAEPGYIVLSIYEEKGRALAEVVEKNHAYEEQHGRSNEKQYFVEVHTLQ